MSHPTHCPSCNIPWLEPHTIYDHFISVGNTPERAAEIAAMYGHTADSPRHFSCNVVGVEVRGKYDGVSYWHCTSCDTHFDRWTLQPTSFPHH